MAWGKLLTRPLPCVLLMQKQIVQQISALTAEHSAILPGRGLREKKGGRGTSHPWGWEAINILEFAPSLVM